jgi:hypothetical protein
MQVEERKVRVKLTWDEQYPVYSIDDGLDAYGDAVDVPYDLLCEYKSAKAMWDRIQKKLRLIDNAIIASKQT